MKRNEFQVEPIKARCIAILVICEWYLLRHYKMTGKKLSPSSRLYRHWFRNGLHNSVSASKGVFCLLGLQVHLVTAAWDSSLGTLMEVEQLRSVVVPVAD